LKAGKRLEITGTGCGVEDMAAKTPGWRRGSSPEAAERCGTSRRALRATTIPVKMNGGREFSEIVACRDGIVRYPKGLVA